MPAQPSTGKDVCWPPIKDTLYHIYPTTLYTGVLTPSYTGLNISVNPLYYLLTCLKSAR